jgi:hypothetical protein
MYIIIIFKLSIKQVVFSIYYCHFFTINEQCAYSNGHCHFFWEMERISFLISHYAFYPVENWNHTRILNFMGLR